MGILLLSIGIIAAAMLAMAAGLLLSGKCLRGSCGGPDVLDAKGESLKCATCPNRGAGPNRKAA